MPYQAAAEDPSKGVVALPHDGDAASTQLLKKQDGQKPATLQGLSSGAVVGIFQKDGTGWVFYFNWSNQIIYRWTPPNSAPQPITLLVQRTPVVGNPIAIGAVVLNNIPWVFYISPFDVLSDVYLIAENGQEWRHGDLAALGLRTSANSPIYASTPTQPSDLLIQVLYIAYDSIGYWASVGLNSNYKWVRVF